MRKINPRWLGALCMPIVLAGCSLTYKHSAYVGEKTVTEYGLFGLPRSSMGGLLPVWRTTREMTPQELDAMAYRNWAAANPGARADDLFAGGEALPDVSPSDDSPAFTFTMDDQGRIHKVPIDPAAALSGNEIDPTRRLDDLVNRLDDMEEQIQGEPARPTSRAVEEAAGPMPVEQGETLRETPPDSLPIGPPILTEPQLEAAPEPAPEAGPWSETEGQESFEAIEGRIQQAQAARLKAIEQRRNPPPSAELELPAPAPKKLKNPKPAPDRSKKTKPAKTRKVNAIPTKNPPASKPVPAGDKKIKIKPGSKKKTPGKTAPKKGASPTKASAKVKVRKPIPAKPARKAKAAPKAKKPDAAAQPKNPPKDEDDKGKEKDDDN